MHVQIMVPAVLSEYSEHYFLTVLDPTVNEENVIFDCQCGSLVGAGAEKAKLPVTLLEDTSPCFSEAMVRMGADFTRGAPVIVTAAGKDIPIGLNP